MKGQIPRLEPRLTLHRLHGCKPPRAIYDPCNAERLLERLTFELPFVGQQGNRRWHRWIDTFLPSPEDICAWEDAPIASINHHR
jgi:hypothetical protein